MPVVGCFLRADTVPLGFVEEMNYGLIRILDPLPFVAVELALEMNHRTEGGSAFQFGWNPGIPIGNRRYGTIEVDSVHSRREVLSVGPVPKERSLFDDHCAFRLLLHKFKI